MDIYTNISHVTMVLKNQPPRLGSHHRRFAPKPVGIFTSAVAPLIAQSGHLFRCGTGMQRRKIPKILSGDGSMFNWLWWYLYIRQKLLYNYFYSIGDGFTRWWFQICFIFTSILGERIQFDEHIFQTGWNRQLGNIPKTEQLGRPKRSSFQAD